MTITYPLALPDDITAAAKISIFMANVVAMGFSPYTGTQQVQEHQGTWWQATIELPSMERADAEEWIGWLTSLYGRKGTFLMGDPSGATIRGSATGTVSVNGADQTGLTLAVDGLPVSQNGVFLSGDWIQLGSGSTTRLYKVVADADSNGAGGTTLDIWPRIREVPADNDPVVYSNAKGLFRLSKNVNGYSYNPGVYTDPIIFDVIEAI